MVECERCGEPGVEGSAYCATCGAPVENEPGADRSEVVRVAPSGGESAAEGSARQDHPSKELNRASASSPEPPSPATRRLVGFLVSFDTVARGQYWPLQQGQVSVGRQGSENGLDIEVRHPTTSSRHASLRASCQPGCVWVTDEGSTNGTFVNGLRLQAGREQPLKDGDRLRFGLFESLIKIIE